MWQNLRQFMKIKKLKKTQLNLFQEILKKYKKLKKNK